MSLRARSLTEVKTPRATTSRSMRPNQSSDLIEPRRIGRSKMQVQLGMIGQELCDPLGLMGREVVGDDVDLPTLGLQRNNLAQESHKLLGGMVGSGLTKDLAAFGVERGIERERAMPIVTRSRGAQLAQG